MWGRPHESSRKVEHRKAGIGTGVSVAIKLIATMKQLVTDAPRATYDRGCNSCRSARAIFRSAVWNPSVKRS
jgi:hypothetical protein